MNPTTEPPRAARRASVPNDVLFCEVARRLAAGQAVTLRAKGGSMYPFIVDGRDSVVLRRPETLRRGDVVLARTQERGWVVHRIVALGPDRVTLMGDANLCIRETCHPADVCGVAAVIVRHGRAVDCGGRAERLRAALWLRLLPVRRGLLFVLRHCRAF